MASDTVAEPPIWKLLIFGRDPRRTLLRVVILTLVSYILFNFVLLPIRVTGFSMSPTYADGKVDFVNRLAYRWSPPKRGDVVAVDEGLRTILLKRVVGMPGERVSIFRGKIYINGHVLEEPNIHSTIPKVYGEWQLNQSEYFVIGDNRPVTVWRKVPADKILGKVVF